MRTVGWAYTLAACHPASSTGGTRCRDTWCSAPLREGLHIPVTDGGAVLCQRVVERNAEEGVTWIRSFVSEDKTRTFCIYDAPSPEAIHKTAARNELPVDQITRVTVLDPYFYA